MGPTTRRLATYTARAEEGARRSAVRPIRRSCPRSVSQHSGSWLQWTPSWGGWRRTRTNGRATWVCHSWGALRMRLFNVSRLPRDAASACQQWRRRRRGGRGAGERLTSWCSGRNRRQAACNEQTGGEQRAWCALRAGVAAHKVVGPAHATARREKWSVAGCWDADAHGRHSHRVVLRIVAELLGDGLCARVHRLSSARAPLSHRAGERGRGSRARARPSAGASSGRAAHGIAKVKGEAAEHVLARRSKGLGSGQLPRHHGVDGAGHG